jgi:hypothetical protein
VYQQLSNDGCFLNFDSAAPDDHFLKDLYRSLRRASGQRRRQEAQIRTLNEGETHSQDTSLLDHLRFLDAAGFRSVDCMYKRLGHAVVGGYKH